MISTTRSWGIIINIQRLLRTRHGTVITSIRRRCSTTTTPTTSRPLATSSKKLLLEFIHLQKRRRVQRVVLRPRQPVWILLQHVLSPLFQLLQRHVLELALAALAVDALVVHCVFEAHAPAHPHQRVPPRGRPVGDLAAFLLGVVLHRAQGAALAAAEVRVAPRVAILRRPPAALHILGPVLALHVDVAALLEEFLSVEVGEQALGVAAVALALAGVVDAEVALEGEREHVVGGALGDVAAAFVAVGADEAGAAVAEAVVVAGLLAEGVLVVVVRAVVVVELGVRCGVGMRVGRKLLLLLIKSIVDLLLI